MESISAYILQDMFYFLDMETLKQCIIVCKNWQKLIKQDSFWKNNFRRKASFSFHCGPYFKYLGHLSYLEVINCENYEVSSFKSMKDLSHKLENPQKLEIAPYKAPSLKRDKLEKSYLKKNEFPLILPYRDSKETNEFLIYELSSESLIFTVNFIPYKESSGFERYPPKFVKISIGQTSDCSDHETIEYEVEKTVNYITISLLPKVISGRFIKFHLIGKQSRDQNENWFVGFDLIEVIGYPSIYKTDPLLKICKTGAFSRSLNDLSPFYLERIERYGMIEKYLKIMIEIRNNAAVYLYKIYKKKIGKNEYKFVGINESIGDYYFQKGKYEKADEIYKCIWCFWGSAKVYIKTRRIDELCKMLKSLIKNVVYTEWVLKKANLYGGEDLERMVREALTMENLLDT